MDRTEGDVRNPAEKADRSELIAKHEALLPARLQKAYDEGPLYRRLFDDAGVAPTDYQEYADLQNFPLVSKDLVRAFRAETGDPFGGIALGMIPGAIVSHGSGTSGTPTLQVTTPADRDVIAEQWATQYWRMGARSGSRILTIQNHGVRAEVPMALGALQIGAVLILPDVASSSLDQLESLRPQISWAYPGWLDAVVGAAQAAGKDVDAAFESLEILWWGGRYLSALRREGLEARVGAKVFEMGGMGDLGLHASSCSARSGMHIREDLFVAETIDPDTDQPLPLGTPGELVFTSLFDEGMNFVRWRSDDFGVVNVEPCSCGRTTARILQMGRVWERTVIDDVALMPGQVDDALYEIAGEDLAFQLVRSADGSRRTYLRLAPPEGVGVEDLRDELCSKLGVQLEVRAASKGDLKDARYGFKYAQVKDE